MAERETKTEEKREHPLNEEANDRLSEARKQKMPFELDMRECYYFSAPLRQRLVNSLTEPPATPMHDDGYLQTSLGYELSQDFATELMNTFMPQAEDWCERKPGMFVDAQAWKQVEKQVRDDDKRIFDAMRASNLYPELAKAFVPDAAIGTFAVHIDRVAPGPICALAVPLRELDINLGPYGEIDDRFITRHTKNRYVKALLSNVYDSVPDDVKEVIEANPQERTQVTWGWWRNWENVGDEEWTHVAMVKNRVVHDTSIKGEGSCPLVVARFGATCDWAFALGPFIQSLPELRQTDELEGQKVQHIELNLTPPIGFPDDSFAAVEQGLEAGMAYPIRPGSEKAVQKLYDPGPAEPGIYAVDDKAKNLRKLFFVDYPEQRGDTPPTLGQWLDELARAQRRIGTPGLPFWYEGPAKIFLRYKYLLEKAGAVKPITVDGKAVSLRPYNPAQRAAEQQEIAMVVRAIQICGQAFPEEFKAFIDGKASMQAIIDKMRVTLLKFRDPAQVEQAIKQITPLLSPRLAPNATAQPAQGVS